MPKHSPHKHSSKKHHLEKGEHKAPVGTKIKAPLSPFITFATFKRGIFSFLLLFIIVILATWVLGIFQMKYSDRFFPGVFVGGEPVGGKTYAESLIHFKEKAEEFTKGGLNENFENSKEMRKINIPMSTSGLTSDNSIEYFTLGDWENDLHKAYKWGHEASLFRSLKEQLMLLFIRKNFYFSSTIQKEAVNSLLENELYVFLKESMPAKFSSTGNKVSISKEEVGESVNKEEVMDILDKKLASFDTTPATFKVQTDMPKVTEAELEPFLDFAENFAKETNLIFQYQEHKWQIKGSKLVTWLTIKTGGGITIDRAKLEDYLTNNVAKFVDNPPQNSRFAVQDGKLVETVPGHSGNIVDIDKTIQKIEKIIPEVQKTFASLGDLSSAIALNAISYEVKFNSQNGTIYLPLETIEVEPKVTQETVDKYFIKDLVGEIQTNFEGSTANREHNIRIGIDAISGILIAPGAEFSTVASIGPVTEKEGYVKELVIKENRTTKEYGGGLCQIATTLFRLALNAGLPITERINHRFAVHYYDPPGLDATIYGPHPDLRFVNDTGSYLLLQARVENKKVIMELYGQKDGRLAQTSKALVYNRIPAPETKYLDSADYPMGETKCFEAPHEGLTTSVLYTVKYPNGTIKEKNFQSVYQPWQKICFIGTAVPITI